MKKCGTGGPNDPQKSPNAFFEFSKSCKKMHPEKHKNNPKHARTQISNTETKLHGLGFGATRVRTAKVALGFEFDVRDNR